MSREITSSSAKAGGAGSPERDHGSAYSGGALRDTAEALASLWASVARFAVGGFETWADRKAERRSLRIRSPGRRPRIAARGDTGARR